MRKNPIKWKATHGVEPMYAAADDINPVKCGLARHPDDAFSDDIADVQDECGRRHVQFLTLLVDK